MERPPTARRTREESGSGCAFACTPSRSRTCTLSQDEVPGWKILRDERLHPDVGPRIGGFDRVLSSPIDTASLRACVGFRSHRGAALADRQEQERVSLAWLEVCRMSTEE